MAADSKRRHFSRAWSLTVVVAIVFLLVAKLAALQRADVIAKLADEVAHGETSEATSAVRNLARIPRPPLAELVGAAASPNLEVAREAQHAIDDYLRFCQREIRTQRHIKQISAQLTLLAEALALQQPSFALADYPWVERTTRRVLLLANQIASRKSPLVAESCDEVLAAISAVRPDQHSHQTNAGRAPDVRGSGNSRETQRHQRLATLAAEPWSDGANATQGGAESPAESGPPTSAVDVTAIPLSVSGERQDAMSSAGPLVSDDLPPASSPVRDRDSDWQAQWSHPVLRTLPARPIPAAPSFQTDAEAGDRWPRAEANRGEADRGRGRPGSLQKREDVDGSVVRADQFSGVDSRKLLARWLVAEGSDVYPLEQALTERGFGRLSARLVDPLFSERVEDRLRLVDEVLTEPGVDPRPWLLLLADDADADVRLVVVTILATSNDRALVEKAWQVAIRDRDPRIAGLAERLRERRSEMQRR